MKKIVEEAKTPTEKTMQGNTESIPNGKAEASGQNHRMTCFVEQRQKNLGRLHTQNKSHAVFMKKWDFQMNGEIMVTSIKHSLCHTVCFR